MATPILSQSGIYVIRNTVNNKVYVGGTRKFSRRFYTHRYKLRRSEADNYKLQQSWNEYGEESFAFEIILLCSIDNIKFYEQLALDSFDSVNQGFNVSARSDSNKGIKAREETKLKMSAVHMGNKHNIGRKASLETREKISKSLIGNKRCVGFKATEESRKKMSAASKGKPKSEQAKINMRNALILRHQRTREARLTALDKAT